MFLFLAFLSVFILFEDSNVSKIKYAGLTRWKGTTINKSNRHYFSTSNLKRVSGCACDRLYVCIRACMRVCVCVCLLYVGYEKAGAAEFSTQE